MTTRGQSQQPFGQRLRHYRQLSGLSQDALGKRAHVSGSYIAMLEVGKRQNPKREIVTSLATALELTKKHTDDLLLTARHIPRGARDDRRAFLKSTLLPYKYTARDKIIAKRLVQMFAQLVEIELADSKGTDLTSKRSKKHLRESKYR